MEHNNAQTIRQTIESLGQSLDAGSIARSKPWPTGFEPFDTVLGGGFHPGEFTLVGGKPGAGKTIAALQWARTSAMAGRPVVYVNLEDGPSAVLGRLLALELASISRSDEVGDRDRLRAMITGLATGAASLDELTREPLGEEACGRVMRYGENLTIVGAGAATVTLDDIAALASTTPLPSIVFVDYMQKLQPPINVGNELERTNAIAEALKKMALRLDTAVVALSAVDHDGLLSRRARMHHLRGSTALAHEPDLIILLNEKFAAVTKEHLAFDSARADRYRSQVIFSIEKNRSGPAAIDLEFTKDFANFRFDPIGAFTTEKLLDSVLFNE